MANERFRDTSSGVGLDVVVTLPAPVIEKIAEAACEGARRDARGLVPGGAHRGRRGGGFGGDLPGPARGAGLRRALGGERIPEPASLGERPAGLGEAGCDALGALPGALNARPGPRGDGTPRASPTRTGRPGGAWWFLVQRAGGSPPRQPCQAFHRLPEIRQRLPDCLGAYTMNLYILTSIVGVQARTPGPIFFGILASRSNERIRARQRPAVRSATDVADRPHADGATAGRRAVRCIGADLRQAATVPPAEQPLGREQ